MAPDPATPENVAECDPMGSIDGSEYVIASPCEDDVWIAASLTDVQPISEWQ